ncbi:MAG: sel1 repeat family protein [Gammaproteobacteria bacterium]|mgnify:CR=1 FL=1|nr:MAG: sel1 repeat family protein [Gammaproteobacteria bacterium]
MNSNLSESLYNKAVELEIANVNSSKIFKAYMKAAMLGSAAAQNALGVFYLLGKNVKKDDVMAKSWLTTAVENGDPNAAINLCTFENSDYCELFYDNDKNLPVKNSDAYMYEQFEIYD